MKKEEEKKAPGKAPAAKAKAAPRKRKVSRTWEAMQRLKGSLIVNDPTFLL